MLVDLGYVYNVDELTLSEPFVESVYVVDGDMESAMEKLQKEDLEDVEVFVNVYEVTREYGGPEEGGWYYNHLELVDAESVRGLDVSKDKRDELEKKYEDRVYGDLGSVRGGVEILVDIESRYAESETTERPHYE